MAKQKPEFIPGIEGVPVNVATTVLKTLFIGASQEHPLHATLQGLLIEKKIEVIEGANSWGARRILARRNGSSIELEFDTDPGRSHYFSSRNRVVNTMPKLKMSGADVRFKMINLTSDLTTAVEKIDAMLAEQEAVDATRRGTKGIADVALEKLVSDVKAANPSHPSVRGTIVGEKATDVAKVGLTVELGSTDRFGDASTTIKASVNKDGSYTLIGASIRGDFDLAKLIQALS